MASPTVAHIISEMYLFYRKTPLGASLFYALAKLVGDGDLPKRVAYAVLEEFDHAILKAIRRPRDEWRISIELFPDHLRWYRYCNGIWWFHLTDVQIYRNFPMRQVARYLHDLRERYCFGTRNKCSLIHSLPCILISRRKASKKLKRGSKFRSKDGFIAVPMETVPSMTILAYTPFSSSPVLGYRTHYVNGWKCRVYEWEENLNPKISIFRYENLRRAKKRAPHAKISGPGGTRVPPPRKSFDPRSAADAVALPVVKSRAEIAKEKEAKFLARRAAERAQRREAMAAAAARALGEAEFADSAGQAEPAEEEDGVGPRSRPAMPWHSKTGVATSGIRQSRPARLNAAPPKKASQE